MINKRVLVLAAELLSLLLVIRVGAHAVGYSVDVLDGTTPIIDGEIAPGEWNDASTLSFNFTIVHLKHDANNLYIAFNISDTTLDSDTEGLYLGLDTSNDGGSSLNQSDDLMIGTFRNGTAFETDGIGPLPPSPGWNVSVFEEAVGYTVEFNVTSGRIGLTASENKTLGLVVLTYDQSGFQYSIWPMMGPGDVLIPSNWGDMMVVFQIEPIYIKPDGSIEGTDKIASLDNITYTFTSNISAPVVVQRSNIVIDGNGWTLDGLDFTFWEGFNLTAVTNVTIADVNIEHFASYSIYLQSASQCTITRNTISGSEGGIGFFSSTGNTVSDNEISGCSEAIELISSSENIVSGNNITDNNSGVYLVVGSTENTVSENSITANPATGIYVTGSSNSNTIAGNNITLSEGNINLHSSSNNTITGNIITAGAEAIQLYASHNNTISNNSMTENGKGIWIRPGSTENLIHGNNVSDNRYEGIAIHGAHNNTISNNILVNNTDAVSGVGASLNTFIGNMMADNRQNGVAFDNAGHNMVSRNEIKTSTINGIFIEGDESTGNTFYHNNIMDNTSPVEVQMGLYGYPPNTWDNGIEGNYWSDYSGVDVDGGGDGLGDSPYVMNANNTDNHPLMGPVTIFDAGIWDEKAYYVHTVSNTTTSDFNFNVTSHLVTFNVTGPDGTLGFCRVAIPRELLWCSDIFDWTVRVNGTLAVPLRIQEHVEDTYLYFTYSHSVQVVEVYGTQVIPEFSYLIILTFFITATLLATTVYKRKEPLKI